MATLITRHLVLILLRYQVKLLRKGLGAWLSSQIICQSLHFGLTATRLKYLISEPSSFFSVHRIRFESCMEHIERVDLTPEKYWCKQILSSVDNNCSVE